MTTDTQDKQQAVLDTVREMRSRGATYDEIAAAIGRSHGSVAGMIHRLRGRHLPKSEARPDIVNPDTLLRRFSWQASE